MTVEVKPDKVAKDWTCTDWSTPVPTPDETSTPEPTATLTGQDCSVSDWYTPDVVTPSPAPTPTFTVTLEPQAAPTVAADVRLVDLGPDASGALWGMSWPAIFLVGVVAFCAVLSVVYFLSKPPTFGAGGR